MEINQWRRVLVALLLTLSACSSPKQVATVYLETFAPEESGLNLLKITDEGMTSVVGSQTSVYQPGDNKYGKSLSQNFSWTTGRCLAVSPDGTELAYVSVVNNQTNVMVRKAATQGTMTQRTFRKVAGVSWGVDDKLYFGDVVSNIQLACTDAHSGSLMRQITSNNNDYDPVLSADGKRLFFMRYGNSGPYIWIYNLGDGSLSCCCRGFNPYPVGDGSESFVCVRKSDSGTTELWLINYDKGQETLVLSDKNRGFTNPCVSSDGKWILCQGNSRSTITNQQNLDVFVVKIDGTSFTQLTYHPQTDCCPMWSPDGKYVYFISSRANKGSLFNLWRMRFRTE